MLKMAYVEYKYNEIETLFDIANAYGITVSELARINNIVEPFNPRPHYIDYLNGIILVPDIYTGGESYENEDRQDVKKVQLESIPQNRSVGFTGEIGWNSQRKCYIDIDDAGKIFFPCFPESFTDTRQSNVTSQNPLGRSEPFQIYQNSGPRTVSVSFRMHREMNHVTDIESVVKAVQSATYPMGWEQTLPKVKLVLGNSCSIKGIIAGTVTSNWSETINPDDQYNVVTLDFSVTECTGTPKLASQIRAEVFS
jgi:hypothetical protein